MRPPRSSKSVIDAMNGKHLTRVVHATDAIDASLAVSAACEGRRKVAVTLPPPDDLPVGETATHITRPNLKDDEVGPMIYRDFLPRALADKRHVPAPSARIVSHGLEALQEALEIQKAGVSGAKIVVTLD